MHSTRYQAFNEMEAASALPDPSENHVTLDFMNRIVERKRHLIKFMEGGRLLLENITGET